MTKVDGIDVPGKEKIPVLKTALMDVPDAASTLNVATNIGNCALAFENLLSVPRAADIAYNSNLSPTKFGDIFDHPNLSGERAVDIIYHDNFNFLSTRAKDKIVESVYGVAKDMTGVKGISHQVTGKKDFVFYTETPDHAYWHRMYNTPAAFETVYQDYTTLMKKEGITPSKSSPNTADPNPQPGACWSVSMIPDGTQIDKWASPGSNPQGVEWDGTYLWHSDGNASYIYQLKTDGTQTGGGVYFTWSLSPRCSMGWGLSMEYRL